jgi:hypothetical protein
MSDHKVTAATPKVISEADYHAADESGEGVCLACGDVNPGHGGWCEGDAEGYQCSACGEPELMGLGNALAEGLLEFTEGDDFSDDD